MVFDDAADGRNTVRVYASECALPGCSFPDFLPEPRPGRSTFPSRTFSTDLGFGVWKKGKTAAVYCTAHTYLLYLPTFTCPTNELKPEQFMRDGTN